MNRKHLLAAAVLLCGTDLVTACNGQTAVDGNSEVISSVDVSQEEAQDVSHAVSQEVSQADSESGAVNTDSDVKDGKDDDKQQEGKVNYSLLFNEIKRTEAYKGMKYANPLITQEFGADPYAMVYDDTVYIYMTQDAFEKSSDGTIKDNSYSKIKSIRVISSKDMVNWTDHGEILNSSQVPWGRKEGGFMWAPDCAYKNGTYYFYFPHPSETNWDNSWKIGVATSCRPAEGFEVKGYIEGMDPLIDPCVFVDDNGQAYIYNGGGGICKGGKLKDNMMELDGLMQPMEGLEDFHEATWVHKYNGKYYFSYSTGDTHLLCYAIGDNPYGPFIYQGVILTPVVGWTTHHAIVEFKGKWYLFHHDCVPSEGKTWLRSLKVCELQYDADGRIITIEGIDKL